MKVVIGIPHTGAVKAPTVLSLVGILSAATHPTLVAMQAGCYVHENRTTLVRVAQDAGATHLFFLDADIQCPDDTVQRLLEHRKPIVGAMYNARQLPPVNTLKMPVATEGKDLPTTLFRCQAIGTGCLLVDMGVFHAVPQPWFWFAHDGVGRLVTGEDVWFCDRAHEAGFDIYCDPTIRVQHIGEYGY